MSYRSRLRCILLSFALLSCTPVLAQDAETYGEALYTPIFERIDANGVDLISGMLRITSPVIVRGSEEQRRTRGLQWTGRSWLFLEQPTIWRDGDKYIVNYRGQSEEFNDRGDNYSQREPITGSTLTCSIFEPGNFASECIYTDRYGDVVHFRGQYSPFTPYPDNYPQSSYGWGNLGMAEARVYSDDRGFRQYGAAQLGGFADPDYNKPTVTLTLGDQILTITTPNLDDENEHYLRPKNVTQTITDSTGSVWRYTFNDDREMTSYDTPGSSVPVEITYYDNHKVKTVTNAAGIWNYSYTTPGDHGTTTVFNPLGEDTYVKYHRAYGYVTEYRDALGRTTYYNYMHRRLVKVTYPEGNFATYSYDIGDSEERGNITSVETWAKPSVGGPVLVQQADYDSTCSDRITCNRPNYIIDAKLNRTDLEYAPSGTRTLYFYNNDSMVVRRGTGKPIIVTSPEPAASKPRPQVRNEYTHGMLVRSAFCRTQSSCVGASDEVVTTYDYGDTEGSARLLFGVAVIADGQTLRTCYGYDSNGRRISETPPIANLASCPQQVAEAPAANATMPTAGGLPTEPVFPDGSMGKGPIPDPEPPTDPDPDPRDPTCGPGTGVVCP